MTESLDDMPSLPVNTADLADKLANDSITCNTGLKDFITKTEVMYDISQLNFSYLTETEFNNKYISTIDNGLVSISVFHVNIRSLNSNHRKLCQFLQLLGIQFDVIVLSEIWRSNIDFYRNILPDYSFHYALPSRGTVGGVGIIIVGKKLLIKRAERYSFVLEQVELLERSILISPAIIQGDD